jgi:hypothetical protein
MWTNSNMWICCLFIMFAGGVCGRWWVGKDWLRAWLPCVMHPAMACAEKPVPYLQGNCLVLAFMVRGFSRLHHFSLLTHCGGGLLFFDRGCAPALFGGVRLCFATLLAWQDEKSKENKIKKTRWFSQFGYIFKKLFVFCIFSSFFALLALKTWSNPLPPLLWFIY